MQERTPNETVYQACVDLRNDGRQINRRILSQVTGLSMKIVDDHVERLESQHGKLRKLQGGYIEVVEIFPANRKIQKTVMGDGMIEIAVGGEALDPWTPSEAAIIGQMLMGEATRFAQLRSDREVSDRVARLEHDNREAKRRITDQAREIARLRQQTQLAFE